MLDMISCERTLLIDSGIVRGTTINTPPLSYSNVSPGASWTGLQLLELGSAELGAADEWLNYPVNSATLFGHLSRLCDLMRPEASETLRNQLYVLAAVCICPSFQPGKCAFVVAEPRASKGS